MRPRGLTDRELARAVAVRAGPCSGGRTTHLLLDPLELIEKIALLIPPPRFHTLRFHGALGPAATAGA